MSATRAMTIQLINPADLGDLAGQARQVDAIAVK
jgi:hypothetical protein